MKIKNILAISALSFALVACSSTETKSTSNLSKENTNISQIQTGNFISDVYDPWSHLIEECIILTTKLKD